MKKIVVGIIVIAAVFLTLLNLPGNVPVAVISGVKLPDSPVTETQVSVHFLKTGSTETPEAFTLAGGSLTRSFEIVHGAILVVHGNDSFLFDTGLGRNIDAQYSEDMPALIRPFMTYSKGHPVVEQLSRSSQLPKPQWIILSHAHWDHASGIVDFPELDVWVTDEEYNFIQSAGPPSIFPSQVNSDSIKWHRYELSNQAYAGFQDSLDIFGDGTAVLVSLAGHSPGSVGLFVNTSDDVRRFFVGDAVWNFKSISELKKKFWISSALVDENKQAAAEVITQLNALWLANPDLHIIPAHDASKWQ